MKIQNLGLNSVVQRDPNVIGAEAGEDVVMVSIDKGEYYGVSEVAREIWQAIESPKKVSDLIDILVESYNVERSLCEKETLLFLEELLAERLLQVTSEPSS
jgi:hypothetical protein